MPLPASNIPAALTDFPHWIGWRYETAEGSTRETKVPYDLQTNRKASSIDPSTWLPYEDACRKLTDRYSGIGFVFTKDLNITGIDFDDCVLPDGSIKPWAFEILSRLDTYMEVSPSGHGIKAWVGGTLPGKGMKVYLSSTGAQLTSDKDPDYDGGIEMYDSGRYFAVTGQILEGAAASVEDGQEIISALYARFRGAPPVTIPQATSPTPISTSVAVEGYRHNHLLRLAAKLRNAGAGDNSLLTQLLEENQLRCSPPKPEPEVRAIVDWFRDKPVGYSLKRADFHDQSYTNGHAPAYTNGHAANPALEEVAVTKYDAMEAAETLLAQVIESKQSHLIYSTKDAPAPYIVALAQCSRSAQERAKSALAAAFKEEFRPRRWDIELKEEIDKVKQSVVVTPKEGWESGLILKSTFTPAPCVTNALLYFENHPDWAGKLAWNEFTGEALVKDALPDPVSLQAGEAVQDHHDTLVQSWLEKKTNDPKWNIDTVRRAVDCWAKAHSFNPVKDYLDGLPKWDGTERLKSWLETFCGAGPAEGDETREARNLSAFISAIGERWWISAIARVFEPGCKVHHVLVLEGAKGIGKTTLAEIIFGEYYAVILGDVTSKDNQALLSAGVWGVLMDELDVLGKSEMRSIKSWVTRDFEKFRPTWGRRHEKRLRQCVFIATVNGDDWAMEEDRRWWPVSCKGSFDLDGLRESRDQLMAEALHRYRAGQRWYFHAEEDAALISIAKTEQAARVPENVNTAVFLAAANKCAGMSMDFPMTCSVGEVLEEIKLPLDRRMAMQAQCGKVLSSSGWTVIKPRGKDGRQYRRYKRPDSYVDSDN